MMNNEHSQQRILQLVPALGDGGVERSAVEMAEYLSGKGIKNWIASAGGPLVSQAEKAGAHHLHIAVGSKSPWGLLSAARALSRFIDAHDIDIVHARSRAPAWAGLLALKLARRKARFVTTFHGVYSHGNALKRFYNSGMLRTPVVIANSQFIRNHIMDVYSYPSDSVIVAPRGIDPDVFDPDAITAEQRADIRLQLGGSADRPLIVMVGRLTGWKGHMVLLEAFSLMKDIGAHLALVGGGDDGYLDELKDKAAALGLGERVTFTGSRRDIPAVLAASDLAVSASTRPEAFGRAAIEAQAMCVPIVATDHGGSRETVIAGQTGWLVPPNDAPALARALDDAFTDPARRIAMGSAGRRNIIENFTTRMMLEKEFSAYTRILGIGG
jgi:glycosyltransferase involved in cell wall biosynthesis